MRKTRWQMLLAGDRLTNSSEPISVISQSIGYEFRIRLQHRLQACHGVFTAAIWPWPESGFRFALGRGRRDRVVVPMMIRPGCCAARILGRFLGGVFTSMACADRFRLAGRCGGNPGGVLGSQGGASDTQGGALDTQGGALAKPERCPGPCCWALSGREVQSGRGGAAIDFVGFAGGGA